MHFATYIVIGIVALIIAGVIIKLVHDKKRGVHCPGCPGSTKNSSCSGCSHYGTHM